MNIREQAIACASACLLCLGPGVVAAQTGAEDPTDPHAQQQQQQQQRQTETEQQREREGQWAEEGPQAEPQQGQERQAQQRQAERQPQAREQREEQRSPRQARGARGSDVFASLDREQRREVQRELQEEGYYEGEIDGIVGPLTRAAVREYQARENLQATGELDRETARALGVVIVEEERQPVAGTTGERPRGEQRQQSAISNRGPNVRAAQEALSREGYHTGAIDGLLGPVTERSIRAFQRAQGLRETGELNRQTMQALGIQVGPATEEGEQAQPGTQPGQQAQPGMQGRAGEQRMRGQEPGQGQPQAPEGGLEDEPMEEDEFDLGFDEEQ